MIRPDRLQTDRAMLFIVDVQTSLLPSIHRHDRVVRATRKLLEGAACFDLPVLATEQYPQGIGRTTDEVDTLLSEHGATRLEKLTFSSCGEEPIRAALRGFDRNQVILAGIEAHVCVQQTVLDLLAMDFRAFVCADAVGSRSPLDHEIALRRMAHAGAAVTTVESVLFELCEKCGTDSFKKMLKVIKAYPPEEE